MWKRLWRSATPSVQAFCIIFPILLGGIPVFLLIAHAPELKHWFLLAYFAYLVLLSLIYAALIVPRRLRALRNQLGDEMFFGLHPLLGKLERRWAAWYALHHPDEPRDDDLILPNGEPDEMGLFLKKLKQEQDQN